MSVIKRRILKNTTALLATRVINQIAGFLLVVFATRSLGVKDFGTYSFLVAFYLTFELISFFGLSNFLPREIGRSRQEAGKYFYHAAILVGAVAVVMVCVMNGASFFYDLDAPTHLAAIILSVALIPASLGAAAEAAFIGVEKAEFITLFTFVKRFLVTGLSVGALLTGHGILALIAIRAAVEFASAAVAVPLCVWQTKAGAVTFDSAFAKAMVKGAVPFAGLAILASVYWRLDVLLLQKLVGPAEVGIYSASYRLMFLLTLIPESFMNAAYPNLARLWKENKDSFARLSERAVRYLFALAVPAAVGAFVLARPVVLLIYEADFERSAIVFSVLIFAIIPIYINNVYYRVLFAAEQQLKSVIILVVNAVVLAGAAIILIPRWGPVGAAAALLISLTVAFVQNFIFARKLVYPSRMGGKVWQTLIASAIMGIATVMVRPFLPWPVLMVAAAALYVPLLILFRVLGKNDLAAIRDVLGRGEKAGAA